MEAARHQTANRNITRLAGIGIVVAFLYFGREILIPLAMATFFCLVLAPFANILENKLRIRRAIGVFLVACAFLALIGGTTWLVGSQAGRLVDDLPRYRDTLLSKTREIAESFQGTFGVASKAVKQSTKEANDSAEASASQRAAQDVVGDHGSINDINRPAAADSGNGTVDIDSEKSGEQEDPVKVEVVSTSFDVLSVAGTFLGTVVHPLATIGASAILLIFFLYYRDDLRDRVVRLFGQARISVTSAALDDCARRIKRFLLAQICANGLIGLFIGVGLHFMGLPNAALWGLIAAVARFLPYIGTFAAAVLPFAVAVAQFDGWLIPIMVIAWSVLVDVLSANVLEPWLYGARTGVAPTAILLSFMFWVWLWGGFGLFLATPITVCLVVIGKHIPAYESIYVLLSDEPVLAPATRFYQRLLGRKSVTAVQVAEKFAREHGRVAMLDQVVLPGLAQIESDHHVGVVDQDRVDFVRNSVKSMIATPPIEASDDIAKSREQWVMGLVTGNGGFDSLLSDAIVEAGKVYDVRIEVDVIQGPASEVLTRVQALKPDLVVFGAFEPRSTGRFQHVLKQLQKKCPKLRVELLIYPGSKAGIRLVRRCLFDMKRNQNTSLARLIESIRCRRNATPTHESQPGSIEWGARTEFH